MNKSLIIEILGNLKAVVRLGHPEAVKMTLDDLRTLPIIAANDHLSERLIDQFIRPAGNLLSRLSSNQLLPLMEDPLTALRAIGAVALAQRYLDGEDVTQRLLVRPAKDSRSEVRTAFGEILRDVGEAHPEYLLRFLGSWLRDDSPKLRATALIIIPALASSQIDDIIVLIEPLKNEGNSDVRAALVKALQAIAQRGLAEPTLELLTAWGSEPHPNAWVITRALSGSWAALYQNKVKAILTSLHEKIGLSKDITNALRALERHGATIEIE